MGRGGETVIDFERDRAVMTSITVGHKERLTEQQAVRGNMSLQEV